MYAFFFGSLENGNSNENWSQQKTFNKIIIIISVGQ